MMCRLSSWPLTSPLAVSSSADAREKRKNEYLRLEPPNPILFKSKQISRFGKRKHEYLRFGKRKHEYLRFG